MPPVVRRLVVARFRGRPLASGPASLVRTPRCACSCSAPSPRTVPCTVRPRRGRRSRRPHARCNTLCVYADGVVRFRLRLTPTPLVLSRVCARRTSISSPQPVCRSRECVGVCALVRAVCCYFAAAAVPCSRRRRSRARYAPPAVGRSSPLVRTSLRRVCRVQ